MDSIDYNIIYEGIIDINKPLDVKTYNIIMGLANTRRMTWDSEKLEKDNIAKKEDIGNDGEFFFGVDNLMGKKLFEFETKYVLDYNSPPMQQPSLSSVWTVTEDMMGLIWNQNEKSYKGHEWLQYIVKRVLIPNGYYPTGIINWFTEENIEDEIIHNHEWHTIVEGNSVRKIHGYSRFQAKPDITAWYNGEDNLFKEYQQQWIRKLIENKIEFLHEDIFNKNEDIMPIYNLSFNVYFDNNVIQVVFDKKNICSARCLYSNIIEKQGILFYDELLYTNKIIKSKNKLNKIKIMIEKYISETSNNYKDSVS